MFQIDKTTSVSTIPRLSETIEPAPGLPRNTVLQDDCIEAMCELPPMSVNFILTEPPYLCR